MSAHDHISKKNYILGSYIIINKVIINIIVKSYNFIWKLPSVLLFSEQAYFLTRQGDKHINVLRGHILKNTEREKAKETASSKLYSIPL